MIDPLYRSDSIFHALFTRARLDQKWSTSVISGLELPNPGFFSSLDKLKPSNY